MFYIPYISYISYMIFVLSGPPTSLLGDPVGNKKKSERARMRRVKLLAQRLRWTRLARAVSQRAITHA